MTWAGYLATVSRRAVATVIRRPGRQWHKAKDLAERPLASRAVRTYPSAAIGASAGAGSAGASGNSTTWPA